MRNIDRVAYRQDEVEFDCLAERVEAEMKKLKRQQLLWWSEDLGGFVHVLAVSATTPYPSDSTPVRNLRIWLVNGGEREVPPCRGDSQHLSLASGRGGRPMTNLESIVREWRADELRAMRAMLRELFSSPYKPEKDGDEEGGLSSYK